MPGQTWGPSSYVIPDAEAGLTPFGGSSDADRDEAVARAIRGPGAAGAGCTVLFVVALTLGLIWFFRFATH